MEKNSGIKKIPIGVKDCEGRQPNEILSLKSDKCVAYDEVLKDFIEKKCWRDLVENDENPNEDVTNESCWRQGHRLLEKLFKFPCMIF